MILPRTVVLGALAVAMTVAALVGFEAADAQSTPSDAVAQGRYLVTLGDCRGCHTNTADKPFAGAKPLETPFGVIYTSNLTPDKATGIGSWSSDQFYRALHEGIRADGAHLYPAFPYPYFTHVSRADSDAIYSYLRTVGPVTQVVPPNKFPFPLNIRSLVAVWNALYFDEGDFKYNPAKSPEWNRGAYLVTGLGHCGGCHTPKNWLAADENEHALAGAALNHWFAADLTGDMRAGLAGWSAAEIVEYLKNGRNAHATASGAMKEVIVLSTSQTSDDDLRAIATYLKEEPPAGAVPVAATPDAVAMRAGGAIFRDQCAACHGADGAGILRMFPPLPRNASVQSNDPTTVVRIILEGSRSPSTSAMPTPLTMPSFAWKLTDQQIADVTSYIRNSWGNQAPPVSESDVRNLRTAIGATKAVNGK